MNRLIKFRIWAKCLNHDKYKEFDAQNVMPPCPKSQNEEEFAAWQKEWNQYNEKRLQHIETCYYHKMVYPNNCDIQYDTVGWTTQGYLDTGAIGKEKTNLNFTPDYVLMQYIGLNDINGREIFEGDIIEYDETDIGGFHRLGEVIYNTDMTLFGAPGFCVWGHKLLSDKNLQEGQSGVGYSVFPFNAKVVGNVFENPELLL